MKIYLAAMWSQREAMRKIARTLEDAGHIIIARWLYEDMDEHDAGLADLADIDACDALILFSAGPRGTMFSGGGRCIEFGYALAKEKKLYLIGPRESVFHLLPQVQQFDFIWQLFSVESAHQPTDS